MTCFESLHTRLSSGQSHTPTKVNNSPQGPVEENNRSINIRGTLSEHKVKADSRWNFNGVMPWLGMRSSVAPGSLY
jgi:hypothetical protein